MIDNGIRIFNYYESVWNTGAQYFKINKKISYHMKFYCVTKLTNLKDELNEEETKKLISMINHLKELKKILSKDDINISKDEYNKFYKKIFIAIDTEDKETNVTYQTSQRFNFVSDVLEAYKVWDNKIVVLQAYCRYKAKNIEECLNKGLIPEKTRYQDFKYNPGMEYQYFTPCEMHDNFGKIKNSSFNSYNNSNNNMNVNNNNFNGNNNNMGFGMNNNFQNSNFNNNQNFNQQNNNYNNSPQENFNINNNNVQEMNNKEYELKKEENLKKSTENIKNNNFNNNNFNNNNNNFNNNNNNNNNINNNNNYNINNNNNNNINNNNNYNINNNNYQNYNNNSNYFPSFSSQLFKKSYVNKIINNDSLLETGFKINQYNDEQYLNKQSENIIKINKEIIKEIRNQNYEKAIQFITNNISILKNFPKKKTVTTIVD